MANHKNTARESLEEKHYHAMNRKEVTLESINEKYFNALRVLINSSADYTTFFQEAEMLIDQYRLAKRITLEQQMHKFISSL